MSRLRNFFSSALAKAEPIHYWVLSLSIIVGGVWILATFNLLQERAKAQSELQSARTQLIAIKKQIEGVHSSYIQINEKLIELPSLAIPIIFRLNCQCRVTKHRH